MKKVLITEAQFNSLGNKGFINEVNLTQIVNRMETEFLPKYKEFISKEGKPNNEESVALFLSKTGQDTNWRVGVLKDLAKAE